MKEQSDWIDSILVTDGAVQERPQPSTVQEPLGTGPAPLEGRMDAPRSRNWVAWLLGGLALLFFLLWISQFIRFSPFPDDGEDIDVDAQGVHVLVIEEVEDRENLTPDQIAIFTSEEVRDWAEANCAKESGTPQFRIYDEEDDPKNDHPLFSTMKEVNKLPPPSVVIVKDGRAVNIPLAEDVESFISDLNKYTK